MRGLIHDTFIEMIDRKIIWMYAVVTLIALVIILSASSFSSNLEINGQMQNNPFEDLIDTAAVKGIGSHIGFMIFLAIFATAGLLPNMLIRGRAEYYLSKPLSRTSLYLNKYLSIWIVYGGMTIVCGLTSYLALYLFHGFSSTTVFYLFAFSLVEFIVWLSITLFAGIVFGSTALSMMTAFLVYILQTILKYYGTFNEIVDSKIMENISVGLYYIFPKMDEMSDIAETLALGNHVDDWMPLWSTLLFSVVVIWATIFIFNRKDY